MGKPELTADEAKDLKKKFDAIKPDSPPFNFAYIEGGEDGRPQLFVSRRPVTEEAKSARRNAKKKKMCQGTVTLKEDKKGFLFTTTEPSPKFALHLVRYFGKAIPRLKRSEVYVPGQEQQSLGDAAKSGVEEAKKQITEIKGSIKKLREQLALEENKASVLMNEATEARNKWYHTSRAADQKQEEAEQAKEASMALRKEIAAMEASLAMEDKDAADLTDSELASNFDDVQLSTEQDIDDAGHRLQELERAAEASETAESRARVKLARLEEAARELALRVQAKERAALDAQVRAEASRGSIFSLRSTADRLERVAYNAKSEAQDIRSEQAEFQKQLEEARGEIDKAVRERQEARARASDFLDRYSEAESSWWSDKNNSKYVASVINALEDSSDKLAGELDKAEKARAETLSIEQVLSTTQRKHSVTEAALARCQQKQRELEDRIKAIESGTDKISGDIIKFLQESHAELEKLTQQVQDLQVRLEKTSQRLGKLQTDLDKARANESAANQEVNKVRLQRNEHAMFLNEREHIRELYTQQPKLQEDVAKLTDEVAKLKEAENTARAAIQLTIDARKRLEGAHNELSALEHEEKALEAEAKKITFFGLSSSREKEAADARRKLIDIRTRKAAASEAYDRASRALKEAEKKSNPTDMKNILQAKKARLEKEQELAEKSHELAEVDSQIAQEEARAATITEDLLTQERSRLLEKLSEKDPQLAQARAQLAELTQEADKVTASLLGQEQRLGVLQEEIESLSERLEQDPGLATELSKKVANLSKAREEIQKARDAAGHEADKVSKAQAAVDAEVARLCGENKRLSRLENALRGAKAEALAAEDRDANANEAQLHADEAREDVLRAVNAAESVAEMESFVSSSQGLIDSFHTLRKPGSVVKSKTIDLTSPDEVDKIREAISAREGLEGAERNEEYIKLIKFQEQLEARAVAMIKAGATVSDLREAFAKVPNGLRPPSYRAEVEAFHTLETAFAELESEKEQSDREKRILEAADSLVTPEERVERVKNMLMSFGGKIEDLEAVTRHIPNTMEMMGYQSTEGSGWDQVISGEIGANPPLVTHLDNVFSSLSALTSGISAASKIVDLSRDTRETDHLTDEKIELDPIEQKRQQDKLLDATLSAVSATLQNTKQFGAMDVAGNTPILGVLGTLDVAKQLAENIVAAAVRRGKARYDQLLADSARVAGSPLAGAFEESVARENQLWKKHGLDATANAATITSHILRGGPPTFAIGVACQIGATAASVGNSLIQDVKDLNKASRAKELLRAARRGDEAAKTELFKHHARYAKGLIAHMAFSERDRFALMYVNKRDINEDMVAKSSAKILAHYLMEEAGQTEDPETWDEWEKKWAERLKLAINVAKMTILAIPNPINMLKAALNSIEKGQTPLLDQAKLEGLSDLERQSTEIIDNHCGALNLIAKIDARIAKTEGDEARSVLRSKRAALVVLMSRYDTFFQKVQEGAVSGLNELSECLKTLDSIKKIDPRRLDESARLSLKITEQWQSRLKTSLAAITRNLANAA